MITDFRWIAWNEAKLDKHGVFKWEAERVVRNAQRPYPKNNGKGKLLVIGRGQGDRVLEVVYALDDAATAFVIHAMPLTTRRRRG